MALFLKSVIKEFVEKDLVDILKITYSILTMCSCVEIFYLHFPFFRILLCS